MDVRNNNKQNAERGQNAKLKCREFSTLQKREIKMQRIISVLQYSNNNKNANNSNNSFLPIQNYSVTDSIVEWTYIKFLS